MRGKLGCLQRGGRHHFALAAFADRMAKEIEHRAVAGIVDAVTILADPVEAGDIAQVLDRARPQQGFPGVAARGRPVGHVQLQVEIQRVLAFDVVAVAREHREAQVVADQRIDAPALPLHHQPLAPGRVAFVFARVAEQMALVVVLELAVWRGPQHAVEYLVAHAQLHAAGDRSIEYARLFAQPRHCRPVHGLGTLDGVVGKTAGEGFRQQYQVGRAVQRRDQFAVVVAVAGRVVPAGRALHEGDAEVVHGVILRLFCRSNVSRELCCRRIKRS